MTGAGGAAPSPGPASLPGTGAAKKVPRPGRRRWLSRAYRGVEAAALAVGAVAAALACLQYISERDARQLARDLQVLSAMQSCIGTLDFSLRQEEEPLHQALFVNLEPERVLAICSAAQRHFDDRSEQYLREERRQEAAIWDCIAEKGPQECGVGGVEVELFGTGSGTPVAPER